LQLTYLPSFLSWHCLLALFIYRAIEQAVPFIVATLRRKYAQLVAEVDLRGRPPSPYRDDCAYRQQRMEDPPMPVLRPAVTPARPVQVPVAVGQLPPAPLLRLEVLPPVLGSPARASGYPPLDHPPSPFLQYERSPQRLVGLLGHHRGHR
jgi:hypothetical protein